MEMTPERWQRIKILFEGALDKSSVQRLEYLTDACADDDDLREEVVRLLDNLQDAHSFLSKSPLTSLDLLATPSHGRFLTSGDVLADRFKLIRFVARGGMGEVYEAEDLELQERVALKLVRPELLLDPRAVQRLRREVLLAKKITHPNVWRIFDLFRHHGSAADTDSSRDLIFISMELLEGATLSQHMRQRGRLSCVDALPLITQIADGLGAAHRVGIVHRDFKPGNVILVPETAGRFRAVITDFGLALQAGGDVTAPIHATGSHGIVGTPAYMAPEQIEGGEITFSNRHIRSRFGHI